jgi:hypothetical protein
MEKSIEKFLEFNGKTIYFLAKDGQYWVAIKPICDALNVDYNRQFQNLKQHPTYAQLFAIQQMVGADNKLRKMASLPERYIYGWISNIRSKSPELIKYQLLCCDILYSYFHGKITSRETVIGKKTKNQLEYDSIIADFRNTPQGQRAFELEKSIRVCNAALKELDREIELNQLPLFKD